MADFTPDEIEQFREQFRKLNEELKRLGGTAFKEMPSDINDVVKSIKFLSNEINDIKNAFSSISQTLKNTITDFNSAGKLISSINNSYGKLSNLTARVQEHISGTNSLSVKELTNIQAKAKVEVENLDNQRKLITGKLSEGDISERQRKTLLAQQSELNDAFEEQQGYLLSIDDLLQQQINKEKIINQNLGLTGNLYKGISKTLQRFGIDNDIIKEMGDELREAADKGKVGFKDLFDTTIKGFKKAMEDPMARFVIGLKLAKSGLNDIKKAFDIFLGFDKTFTETARGLGMSTDQIYKMTNAVKLSGSEFSNNAYTAEQITKAISDVNNQLGLSVDIGSKTVDEFAAMTNQMGLSAEEATKIYKLGLLTNTSLENTNKSIAGGIIAAQKQFGVQVNQRQVFQEIGKLSAGITAKFQQNPEAIAKAVVQAKALGTSLETIDKVGESLLNFESSIENQLKAQLLTGKQLNLEQARYAALTGDQATLMSEISSQVGSLADFTHMNVIAQRSLAEAFGMSKDELADMLQKQETFNKLGDVSGKSAQEQLAIARERKLSETDSLMVNLKQQAVAEKTAAAFDNFKSAIAGVLDSLKPVLDLMTSLSKQAWLVYTALGLMAGISLAKTVGGIALMITSLAAANIEAITLKTILTSGAFLVGLPLLLGAAYGIYKSATSSAKETAFASGGIVTGKITNATVGEAGPEAIIPLNSPKASSMMGGAGLLPMISALNDAVTSLMNRQQPTPQFALHVDGKQLGTVVGQQMETGTAQNIYTGYRMA